MTAEKMFELMGNAEDELIADAAGKQRRRRRGKWLRWGAAAACVCLLAAGALALASREQRGYTMAGGEAVAPGGSWPEGVDPRMASIAVYPAAERPEDLADATLTSLSEQEAYGTEGLSDFLPRQLPEGYRFHFAHLYETTMKSGSVYHMLRVDYWTGSGGGLDAFPSDGQEDGAEVPPGGQEESFAVFVMDYAPRTEKRIYDYAPADGIHYMVRAYPRPKEGGVFHIRCGDAYIGVDPLDLSASELHSLLDDITEGYYYPP